MARAQQQRYILCHLMLLICMTFCDRDLISDKSRAALLCKCLFGRITHFEWRLSVGICITHTKCGEWTSGFKLGAECRPIYYGGTGRPTKLTRGGWDRGDGPFLPRRRSTFLHFSGVAKPLSRNQITRLEAALVNESKCQRGICTIRPFWAQTLGAALYSPSSSTGGKS